MKKATKCKLTGSMVCVGVASKFSDGAAWCDLPIVQVLRTEKRYERPAFVRVTLALASCVNTRQTMVDARIRLEMFASIPAKTRDSIHRARLQRIKTGG